MHSEFSRVEKEPEVFLARNGTRTSLQLIIFGSGALYKAATEEKVQGDACFSRMVVQMSITSFIFNAIQNVDLSSLS